MYTDDEGGEDWILLKSPLCIGMMRVGRTDVTDVTLVYSDDDG